MNKYLEAAERIYDGANTYSCCAVQCAALGDGESTEYSKLFSPREGSNPGGFWLDGELMEWGPLLRAAEKNWRLTALCFASAMYETGDLP